MERQRKGCSPIWWLLAILLLLVRCTDFSTFGGGDAFGDQPVAAEQIGEGANANPRRPDPYNGDYIIAAPGQMQDSQGTGFIIDDDGIWLTAQHVTSGCDRLGLYDGIDLVPVSRVSESGFADGAVIRDGPRMASALPLSGAIPRNGVTGWHMGFPGGDDAIVETVLLGESVAHRGYGPGARHEPVLAWAEVRRIGYGSGSLGGISGGPVLTADGNVVGVVSASTDRRGRILSTSPTAIGNLLSQTVRISGPQLRQSLGDAGSAQRAFRQWLAAGVIRQVYCDVR